METLIVPKLDIITLAGNLLYIVDKRGYVVPFKFNPVQSYFHANKGLRNIILKARQVGVSSSILASMFIDCLLIPYINCAVVSHETRATQRLLDRVQFYYDSMGEPKLSLDGEDSKGDTEQHLHWYLWF